MAGDSDRLKVFISYARRDASDFAQDLLDALEVAGFDPFLDRHDIVAGEDWEARLAALIAEGDTIVFVITPAGIASERCAWEVAKAEALGKRIIPVVAIDVPTEQTPPSLARRNYVSFAGAHSFGRALKSLTSALNTDLGWLREHTRLAELARRWSAHQRSTALLLRGPELETARRWLADATDENSPTEAHRDFIAASDDNERREAETEAVRLGQVAREQDAKQKALDLASRRNVIIRLVSAGALAVGGGLAFVGWQLLETRKQTVEAFVDKESQRTDLAGQFIAYGASPGTALAMSPEWRSMFSRYVLGELQNPSISIFDAVLKAQDSFRLTERQQRPLISTNLNGEVYPHRQPPTRKLTALAVSVNDSPDGSKTGPADDAAAWADLLRETGFAPDMLTDPTSAAIRAALAGLAARPPPGANATSASLTRVSARIVPAAPTLIEPDNSLAFFYFSGAGVSWEGHNYICGSDLDTSSIEAVLQTSIEVSDIAAALSRAAVASILILDVQFRELG